MNKTETLNFLAHKRALTADTQDARHAVYVAKNDYDKLRKQVKWLLIGAFVGVFILGYISVGFGKIISNIVTYAALAGWVYLAYLQHGKKQVGKQKIAAAEQQVDAAMAVPAYIEGMQDFPQKFYSYWTIDRLMHLVSENRAATLQEAFNVAETQDFQNDQLALQQENLAVAKATNSAANISAAANVVSALNSRK
ncbi:hypothetical protein [Lactiplantibacillus daowaiensis]|uniref:Uncharacterized protein n=1 Tax=Lactiplantibacillus daowaiensis TaxID=2559918 RepID=A0ABW1RZL1_9LACO|nr:hypothetical protein [Lactiplantibacillus daowaiensis]